MKLKRTSVKVLLSASIILSMIPFYVLHVKADSGDLHKVYSITIEGSLRYDYIDYYYISNYSDSGTFTLTVNNYFVFNASNVSSYGFGLVDSDGGAEITSTTTQTSGSGTTRATKITYEITMHNCSYWHGRLFLRTDTTWFPTTDNKTLTGKYGLVESFGSITSSGGYMAGSNYYLRQILTALQNGSGTGGSTVDLSTVEEFLSDILVNLDIQLGYQYDINTKMDIIINQLQTQQGSPSQDSIDDNTQANEDLQTESETYQQLESEFNDNFTDSLENVPTQTLEDHLQNWSTGVNWFRTQMDNIYNNLGEFKYICSIAIVLAIALIFIGR